MNTDPRSTKPSSPMADEGVSVYSSPRFNSPLSSCVKVLHYTTGLLIDFVKLWCDCDGDANSPLVLEWWKREYISPEEEEKRGVWGNPGYIIYEITSLLERCPKILPEEYMLGLTGFISRVNEIDCKKMAEIRLREAYKESRKEERRRMTPSLRYSILQRDGFRCKVCGAGPEDEKLVVDHIIPISKGGKSDPDNLRALCFTCNAGKGVKQ